MQESSQDVPIKGQYRLRVGKVVWWDELLFFPDEAAGVLSIKPRRMVDLPNYPEVSGVDPGEAFVNMLNALAGYVEEHGDQLLMDELERQDISYVYGDSWIASEGIW